MRTICTIIAKNYAAFARTLCRSFLEQHPDGQCFVLVIDDWQGFLDPAQEPFTIVSLDEIDLPQPRAHFTFKYDITELSTAVKPFLLEHLLGRYALPNLLYLDPDILITAPLEGLFTRLEGEAAPDFVLTPHLDRDYPDDGLRPGDAHILTSGIYNLGFFGLRSGANPTAFLRWWQQKLTNHCIIAHKRGYFVDQRFIDLALSLFPGFYIEKDTGYNAAYWNLHSRRFRRDDTGHWLCNEGSLFFYHFSNYKINQPNVLSGFLNRYHLQDRPDLQPLFADYHRQILAHGHQQTRLWPYTFGHLQDGCAIPHPVRAIYRSLTDARGKVPTNDPFASKGLSRLCSVVNSYQAATTDLKKLLRPAVRALRRQYARL